MRVFSEFELHAMLGKLNGENLRRITPPVSERMHENVELVLCIAKF